MQMRLMWMIIGHCSKQSVKIVNMSENLVGKMDSYIHRSADCDNMHEQRLSL